MEPTVIKGQGNTTCAARAPAARSVGNMMARNSSAREELLTAPTRELQVVDTSYLPSHSAVGRTQFFIINFFSLLEHFT